MVIVSGLGAIPDDAIVLLVGASGSGKSTWARDRFGPGVVLSSDAYRAAVAGDAADQSANADAFRVLHLIARARASRGLLSVIDATNLTAGARSGLSRIARKAGRPTVAVIFDISLEHCLAQNAARPDRQVPDDVVRRHLGQLAQARTQLSGEGYAQIHVITDGDLMPA